MRPDPRAGGRVIHVSSTSVPDGLFYFFRKGLRGIISGAFAS